MRKGSRRVELNYLNRSVFVLFILVNEFTCVACWTSCTLPSFRWMRLTPILLSSSRCSGLFAMKSWALSGGRPIPGSLGGRKLKHLRYKTQIGEVTRTTYNQHNLKIYIPVGGRTGAAFVHSTANWFSQITWEGRVRKQEAGVGAGPVGVI